MKPSSSKNSKNNDDNDAQLQTPPEDDANSEKSDLIEGMKYIDTAETSEILGTESSPSGNFEGIDVVTSQEQINRAIMSELTEVVDNSESNAPAGSELLPGGNLEAVHVITSQKQINRTVISELTEMVDTNESNLAPSSEPFPSSNSEAISASISEKQLSKLRKISVQKLWDISRKFANIFSYQAGNQQNRPFQQRQNQQRQVPAPPHYYSSAIRQRDEERERQQREANERRQREGNERRQREENERRQREENERQQREENKRRKRQRQAPPEQEEASQRTAPPARRKAQPRNQNAEYHYAAPNYIPLTQLDVFPYVYSEIVQWAAYPTSVPQNVPPALAHFFNLEVLFVIQKLDLIELITDIPEPNCFLVLNKSGQCIYYVYETSEICAQDCLGKMRGFQLHVVDLYHSEVILMNKLCGCTKCFCCYPAMEVYSPPTVPLGVVTKVCNGCKERFVIKDPDGNVMFTTVAKNCCAMGCLNTTLDLSICAVDENRTEVGYIRRDFVESPDRFANFDYYGLSFPGNMDVRIKALFLGALFLISLKRTGWVLRNVEDPETISGHMYRMSIMAFLIPESSGVDKTKCMKLSLVHDLAECIVGDLTPYCGVDANEKHRQEEVAMKELTKMIGVSGAEIYTLYKEYEAQVTDESKFVKDLDRLDMILQAFEYEKLGDKPGKLEEFFTSTYNKFHFPWTIDIVKEIYKQRNLHINKDKSVGKDP